MNEVQRRLPRSHETSERKRVACAVQRVRITSQTERELFGRAGGYCQNPADRRSIFVEVGDRSISVGEMAHVIAAGNRGPRGDVAVTPEAGAHISNLLLLCPTCHTIVDKAPDVYSRDLLLEWKRTHEGRIRALFEVNTFASRSQARSALQPLLLRTEVVFREYGPASIRAERDAFGEAAAVWHRKVLGEILPTNRRILFLLDANSHLLTPEETPILEAYRQHVDDFEGRHLFGLLEPHAATFPIEVRAILS